MNNLARALLPGALLNGQVSGVPAQTLANGESW